MEICTDWHEKCHFQSNVGWIQASLGGPLVGSFRGGVEKWKEKLHFFAKIAIRPTHYSVADVFDVSKGCYYDFTH